MAATPARVQTIAIEMNMSAPFLLGRFVLNSLRIVFPIIEFPGLI